MPADKLSPFKFYQYLLTNVGDEEVITFLRMLTFVPLEDLEALQRSMQEPGYKPNTAQRLLAAEVTSFVHGQQGLDQALKATEVCTWAPAPAWSHVALQKRKLACQLSASCRHLSAVLRLCKGACTQVSRPDVAECVRIKPLCTDRIRSTDMWDWSVSSSDQWNMFNLRHVLDWCASC